MTEQLLQRGDVVAYAGRYFVVWKATSRDLEAFPISFGPGCVRGLYRVPIGEEIATWGITDEQAAAVAGERELLACTAPLRAIRVGRCSAGLICRIVGAAARAYAAQSMQHLGRDGCNNNSPKTAVVIAAE